MEHTHEYLHEHGIAHTHGEGHGHVHENTKAVLNRLARAIGHLESVKKMVEDGRDCSKRSFPVRRAYIPSCQR